MKTFCGGQIRTDAIGDLAVVINVNMKDDKYNVFICTPLSEEFNHITGVMAASYPVERVYIGISNQISG